MKVGEKVYPRIEEARTTGVIGKPLGAAITLVAPPTVYDFLLPYLDRLNAIFIVSHVELERAEEDVELQTQVEPTRGARCERCWLVLPTVGERAVYPTLCARCADVVMAVY